MCIYPYRIRNEKKAGGSSNSQSVLNKKINKNNNIYNRQVLTTVCKFKINLGNSSK